MEIELEHAHMRVLVPEDAVGRVGLRSVIDGAMLSRVLDVLREEPAPVAEAWPAKSKSYRRRFADGDVLEVAALVRDLEGRSSCRNGLSALERGLLETCRRQLVSELAVALRLAPTDAEARLDSLVNQRRSRDGHLEWPGKRRVALACAASPRISARSVATFRRARQRGVADVKVASLPP